MTETDNSGQAEKRIYELGFHIVSSIPEEKLPAEVTAIKDVLAANDAVFLSEDFPKLKHLSYVMTKIVGPKHLKFDTAYFGWLKFEMNPELIDAVKIAVERNEHILRFIIMKTVKESTLFVARPPVFRSEPKPIPAFDKKKEASAKSPISEAELDKTIDALVVE